MSHQAAGIFRPRGWDATKRVRVLGDDNSNMCTWEFGEIKKKQQQ